MLTKLKCYFIIIHVVTDAEIAQLVEHNLAKVGVASSSLVFRSMQIHPGLMTGIFLLQGKPFLKETVRFRGNRQTLCRFHRNFSFERGFFGVFACQIEYVVILYCSIVKMGWFLYPKIYRVITNSNIYLREDFFK